MIMIDSDHKIVEINGKVFENYHVSKTGQIWSKNINRYLKSRNIGDYFQARLRNKDGAYNFYVHIIVATVFIDNPDNLPVVNHKDGNKFNNTVENLEWCTRSYNIQHAHDTGLTKCTREVIQLSLEGKKIAEYKSISEAARITKISRTNIGECCTGKPQSGTGYKHYTAGGFKWEYKNQVEIKNKIRHNKPDLSQCEKIKVKNIVCDNYYITKTGLIWSVDTQLYLKLGTANGYQHTSIYINKKAYTVYVHRLVARAFIPYTNESKIVNHKDGNKLNNTVENLEWCNHETNIQHAYDTGLIKSVRPVIQFTLEGEKVTEYKCMREAARITNIHSQNICKACKGQARTAGGFKWSYKDAA